MTPEEKQALAEEKRYRAFLEEWNDRPVKVQHAPHTDSRWEKVEQERKIRDIEIALEDIKASRNTWMVKSKNQAKEIERLKSGLEAAADSRDRWRELCHRFESLCRENGIDPLDAKGDPKPCA